MLFVLPDEQSEHTGSTMLRALNQIRLPFGLPARIVILVAAAAGLISVVLLLRPDTPRALSTDVAESALILGATFDSDHNFTADQAESLNLLLISGAEVQTDGAIDQSQLRIPADLPDTANVLPILRVTKPVSDDLFSDSYIDQVADFASDENFAGIVIDYGVLSPSNASAFAGFVSLLDKAMSSDATLIIRVPMPDETDSAWETYGYDWAQLAESADYVLIAPISPAEVRAGGKIECLLAWASPQISRSRLLISLSALSIDQWGAQLNPIPFEYALAPIGSVRQDATQSDETLTFHLASDAVNLQQNDDLYSYEFYAGDGIHRIHVITGAALRAQLEWLRSLNMGGIILDGYFSPDASTSISVAVREFLNSEPSSLEADFALHWKVTTSEGEVLADTTAALGTPFEWKPSKDGAYIVSADLIIDQPVERGSAMVSVGTPSANIASENEEVVSDAPTPIASAGGNAPPAVIPAGVGGSFELGGQVSGVLAYPDRMRQAGMKWVKHQVQWGPQNDPAAAAALIQSAKAQGFKVLLSVPGRAHYPDTIDFAGYVEFVRALAGYGPDAIEVWNEANLDFEWPRGKIDGGSYVRDMLAPAYNAIKSVNPSIMVISGALAPTGAFYGEGGCSKEGYGCDDWLYLQQMAQAGAANYMDCVGVHYNSGATSPTASTGHPADPGFQHYSWYYSGMVQLYGGTFGRPLCFTELGYLTGEGLGAVPGRFSWAQDTSLAEQAQWLAEAVQLSRQNGSIRLLIVWNVDFTNWGDDPMAGYAILRPDGSCPACDALDQVMP